MKDYNESIKSKLQFLSNKYNIRTPELVIEYQYQSTAQYAQTWYNKTYDMCYVKFILNQDTTEQKVNYFIAHQFAHCMIKQMMLMEELTLERTDNCKTLYEMFRRSQQLIAMRLENIFVEDLNKEYRQKK